MPFSICPYCHQNIRILSKREGLLAHIYFHHFENYVTTMTKQDSTLRRTVPTHCSCCDLTRDNHNFHPSMSGDSLFVKPPNTTSLQHTQSFSSTSCQPPTPPPTLTPPPSFSNNPTEERIYPDLSRLKLSDLKCPVCDYDHDLKYCAFVTCRNCGDVHLYKDCPLLST